MKRYAEWLLRCRAWVIGLTVVVTVVLSAFAARLHIVIDPATMVPDGHPYVDATNRIASLFGSKYLVVIGVRPKQGDIFQPAVLEKVERITRRLESTPGVVRATLVSLAARQAKAIRGSAGGFEARPLIAEVRSARAGSDDPQATILANPIYLNTVVSPDFTTTAILVELQERSDGFRSMLAPIHAVLQAEHDPALDVSVGGSPVYLELTETFAERINFLFPLAICVIGLLHFEAFRTRQGLVLPLVTALIAVVWGVGLIGVLGQPLDIFNSPTPILILAVAAGHAVQLLKRYYEEYEALAKPGKLSPEAANREAVIQSLVGVGPVMIIAGTVAALGFFSLIVFDIATIRTFGIFTGIGILSAVLLEMTFIPAVRSLLKPPPHGLHVTRSSARLWDRIPMWIGDQIIPVGRRRRVLIVFGLATVACIVGMQRVVINSDSKSFFSSDLQIQRSDAFLNRAFGGTNGLYIMVDGGKPDAIKAPETLRAIASLQRFAEAQPNVGKTVSIVDFVGRMHQAMHGDELPPAVVPDDANLVSQYLLLYSMSGDPGDFDGYVDYPYRAAKITVLLKDGSSAAVAPLISSLQARAGQLFGETAVVSFGGDVAQTIAISDTMIQGKLRNIVQVSLAIFLVSAVAFHSLAAGLIVMLPLALSVVAVFGAMGAFGIPLNVPNALISAMAVGIGADYAIYLLYRMREYLRAGAEPELAVRKTLATAGKAALFVATAVAGGYGVLALSFGYNVHLWLSLFIVLAMLVSVCASLALVPSMVLSLRPSFMFQTVRGVSVPQCALACAIGAGLLLGQARPAQAEAVDAGDAMRKSAEAVKVKDSISSATFTLTNKDGATRVRKVTGHTRLQANGADAMRMVRFVWPADIKGTATLLIEHAQADDDMWIYLPALSKVRRLSGANKKDSFVGTDFSYGDVVGHKADEWRHKLVKEDGVDGAPCWVIESEPLSDAVRQNTGYARRLSWIRKDNFVAVRTDFWDASGQPLKRIVVRAIQQVGSNGRWQPMQSEAENLQSGHKTTLQIDQLAVEQGVPESLFVPKELEK